jgi:hypothetical protein
MRGLHEAAMWQDVKKSRGRNFSEVERGDKEVSRL